MSTPIPVMYISSIGGRMELGINHTGGRIVGQLTPGQTYFMNIKNITPLSPNNIPLHVWANRIVT